MYKKKVTIKRKKNNNTTSCKMHSYCNFTKKKKTANICFKYGQWPFSLKKVNERTIQCSTTTAPLLHICRHAVKSGFKFHANSREIRICGSLCWKQEEFVLKCISIKFKARLEL